MGRINNIELPGKNEAIFESDYEVKKRGRGRPRKDEGRINKLLHRSVEGDLRKVVPVYEAYQEGTGELTMLTPYEHAFAVAYVKTSSAGKAAQIAAPPDKRTDKRNWPKVGYDLLRRPAVMQAIGMMQKKLCIAAALDSTDVISNIREVAALAMAEGKYEAALKANQMLGAYLGIDFGQAGARPGPKSLAPEQVSIGDVFKSGEELTDAHSDISKLLANLNLSTT